MIRLLAKKLLPQSAQLALKKVTILRNNWDTMKLYQYNNSESGIISELPFFSISKPGQHCFFGYYDIAPFNEDSTKILNLTTGEKLNKADINLYNVENGHNSFLVRTHIWNWQQGCRLRWHPTRNNVIVYNDFENGHYCCKIYDIAQKQYLKELDYALYDLDSTGHYGLSLDFSRLGVRRPGYGYTALSYNQKSVGEEGVDLIDVAQNTCKRLFTYKDLRVFMGIQKDYDSYYINHLSFSPSGNRFMFFFLDSTTSRHEAYMFVYDLSTNKIIPLETKDKVSHYVWNGNDEIIATVYDDNMTCGYYIYDLNSRIRTKYNDIAEDGHPSMISADTIVTDTYPDKQLFQHLFFMDNNGIKKVIAQIYNDPLYFGECRTDLHPRLDMNHSLVCVDANIKGHRGMYVFDLRKVQ